MSDKKFELSRRNALIGLGTVGVASAGAGVGTSAFFSDAEEITGNSIQAGEFGLTVVPSVESVDQDGIGPDEMTFNESGDSLLAQGAFSITDAKPGDEYEFCYEVTVSDNPGLAKLVVTNYTDQDGEAADKVNASDLYNVSSSDLSTLGEAADVTIELIDSGGNVYATPYDGASLAAVLGDLSGNGLVVPSDGNTNGEGETCHAADTPISVCVTISIPDTVGNEIQGAMTSFDLTVYAEQCRHNTESEFANVSV